MRLPPQDLPEANSMALSVSLSEANRTNAKPRPHLLLRSEGIKMSVIMPALQNIASFSAFEVSSERFEMNREIDLSLKYRSCFERGCQEEDEPP